MLKSPTYIALVDSLVRILLTIIIFYTVEYFFAVQNTLVLALVSVVIAHVVFRSFLSLLRRQKKQHDVDSNSE